VGRLGINKWDEPEQPVSLSHKPMDPNAKPKIDLVAQAAKSRPRIYSSYLDRIDYGWDLAKQIMTPYKKKKDAVSRKN
jgi:hypothetical protein